MTGVATFSWGLKQVPTSQLIITRTYSNRTCHYRWTGMAQCWERMQPINYVAQIRILNSTTSCFEFVIGSRLSLLRLFSRFFSITSKNSNQISRNREQRASCGINVPLWKFLFMYLFMYYLHLNDTWWTFTFSYEEGTVTLHLQKGFFCLTSCYLSMEPAVI